MELLFIKLAFVNGITRYAGLLAQSTENELILMTFMPATDRVLIDKRTDGRGSRRKAVLHDRLRLERFEARVRRLDADGGTDRVRKLGRARGREDDVHAIRHKILEAARGVLIRDADGTLLGAVGVTGDTSDNDEICALAGIAATGLVADTGA